MPPRRSNSTIHVSTRVKNAQNQQEDLDDEIYDDGSANNDGAGHSASNRKVTAGRWTQEEKDRFKEAIQIYGKDWKSV